MTQLFPPIQVKVVTRSGEGISFPWHKQCPGDVPSWKNCNFTSLPSCREYDWLVVIDDIPKVQLAHKEVLACPKTNTVLTTTEPSSVTCYGRAFANQFSILLTNQEDWALPHPNTIRSQTGNIWFYGKNYDTIKKEIPLKTDLISTVCSSKQQKHTMHAQRFNFTQKLKAQIAELEIFGHGVRFVENKYEALDPYKFHLVIENHFAPHVWTEKLADTFLACSVPIYCGCTNVFDYFPEDSLIQIDISDFDSALKTIRRVLSQEGEYERRLNAVLRARELVMDSYNFPAIIHRIVNTDTVSDHEGAEIIYSRRLMRLRQPADLIHFLTWKTSHFFNKNSISERPNGR